MVQPASKRLLTEATARAAFVAGGNRIPVCDRVHPPIFGAFSDGTKQGRAYRTRHAVIASGHSLRIGYSNYRNGGTGVELDGQNKVTVFAAIESTSGATPIPITPKGGAALQPGETKYFDVGMDVVAGDVVWIRTQVAVDTLGEVWGKGNPIYATGEGYRDTTGAPFTDVTVSSAPGDFTYAADNGFGPSSVTAIHEGAPLPSVLVVGTSIAYGVSNSDGPDRSWITQALVAAGIPHQNLAMPSSKALEFNTLEGRRRRMVLTNGIRHTHAIFEHYTNDRTVSSSDIKDRMIAGWRTLARRGLKVWACTGLPATDAGNTTPEGTLAAKTAFNGWIRDGAPLNATTFAHAAIGSVAAGVVRFGQPGHPAVGYFDPALLGESAPDSGLWKAGYTTDGIHPNALGHNSIKAAINTAVFTA